MKRQDELNEAWCKYMGKFSTEIMQALAFALRWADAHPCTTKERRPTMTRKNKTTDALKVAIAFQRMREVIEYHPGDYDAMSDCVKQLHPDKVGGRNWYELNSKDEFYHDAIGAIRWFYDWYKSHPLHRHGEDPIHDGFFCGNWAHIPDIAAIVLRNFKQGKISPNRIIGTPEHIQVALDMIGKKGNEK